MQENIEKQNIVRMWAIFHANKEHFSPTSSNPLRQFLDMLLASRKDRDVQKLNLDVMHWGLDKMMGGKKILMLDHRYQWVTKHAWWSQCQKGAVFVGNPDKRKFQGDETTESSHAFLGEWSNFLGLMLGTPLFKILLGRKRLDHSNWTKNGMRTPLWIWCKQILIRKTTGRW